MPEINELDSLSTPIMISVPVGMRLKLEQLAEAEEGNPPLGSFVRDIVAESIGYELESKGRARKYASDKERKDAAKAKADERRNKVKAILEAQREKLGISAD